MILGTSMSGKNAKRLDNLSGKYIKGFPKKKNIGCQTSAVNIEIVDLKRENLAVGGTLFIDNK